MTYITGNVYDMSVRHTAQGKMPWVRAAEIEAEVTKTSRGSTVVIPMTVLDEEIDDTDLALDSPSDTIITTDDRDVSIDLKKYGKKYQVYDGTASLQETVPDRALNSKVIRQTRLAANTLDSLAAAAATVIPADGTYLLHEMGETSGGPGVRFADTVGSGLIHFGNATESLANAGLIPVDGKLTAAILRTIVQVLQARGVDPVGYLDGGDMNTFLYKCIMTDRQIVDLRAEVGNDSIVSTNKYLAADSRILTGTFTVWGNLLIQVSPRAKEVISPEEGDDFYAHRCVVFGMGYLGMGATLAGNFPESGPVEKIGMFAMLDDAEKATTGGDTAAMPRIFEIRKVPYGDAQGTMSKISWLSVCGFKLLDPRRGCQIVTRASGDPEITP